MAEESTTPEQVEPSADLEIAPELIQRRDAALALIVKFGEPVLRSTARPVVEFDYDLEVEVERMVSIMRDSMGIGLAAPQIGSSRRVLVYQVGHDQRPVALVNPQLEWSSRDEEVLEEGCLSLPGVHVDVERPVYVRISALDQQGKKRRVEASGLEARVIMHELDHLDGVLILDRASKEQRREAMREIREAEADSGFAA